jgi:predicted signal transduction protein with EAL and GGDEF domain
VKTDDLPALLDNARRMVAALEAALEAAREQERRIADAITGR